MTTPDWPEREVRKLIRMDYKDFRPAEEFVAKPYVLELERRYAIAVEALLELADLMDDTLTKNYVPDSFTTQPARKALAQCPLLPKEKERE